MIIKKLENYPTKTVINFTDTGIFFYKACH